MKMREFGEVEVVFPGEKIPKGMVIRERRDRVMLEEHFDTSGQNYDVLQEFEPGCSLLKKEDILYFLAEAREYETDFEIPIYIVASKAVEVPKEEDDSEARKECMMCKLKWNQKHPWSLSPPIETCSKCQVIKRKSPNS